MLNMFYYTSISDVCKVRLIIQKDILFLEIGNFIEVYDFWCSPKKTRLKPSAPWFVKNLYSD
jgi:hypothetical protein